jgi:membrane associated rhomboid family serine protease
MIPIRDVNPTRRLAILTIGLIVVNVAVFLFQIQRPADATASGQTAFICEFGLVPERVIDNPPRVVDGELTCLQVSQERPRFLGVLTSQFLHGGWLHLIGNMLFLWVFGNNIEDRLGRLRFLPFYLACGAIAGLAQAATDPSSDIPVIGASGAIAGILGAYLVLYPRKRVWTIVLPFFFLPFQLPAWVWLGIYFAMQFLFLGAETTAGDGGGVAYTAHIAGFAAGILLIKPFALGRHEPPPPAPAMPVVTGWR